MMTFISRLKHWLLSFFVRCDMLYHPVTWRGVTVLDGYEVHHFSCDCGEIQVDRRVDLK